MTQAVQRLPNSILLGKALSRGQGDFWVSHRPATGGRLHAHSVPAALMEANDTVACAMCDAELPVRRDGRLAGHICA